MSPRGTNENSSPQGAAKSQRPKRQRRAGAPSGPNAKRRARSERKAPLVPISDLISSNRLLLALAALVLISPMASAEVNQHADEMVRKVWAWAGSPLDDKEPDTSKWVPGATELVKITLVTEDELRLTCGSDELVADKYHCALKAKKVRWPKPPGSPVDDNQANIIQPYRTLEGNKLIFLAGVWAQPEIATRAHQEPAGVVPVKRQQRFVAYCRVRFHAIFETAFVRWFPGAKWFTEKNVPVAEAERCATHDFTRQR